MADTRAQHLTEQGDHLFSKRSSVLSLWQEIALNFYVERADFTFQRHLGTDFAEHLMTSYPLLVRRDLGDAFSAMLRPTSKEWFYLRTQREEREDEPARAWLEYAASVMRRAMYDRVTQFTRATKEGDHDFATFGQCVLSVELNRKGDALLYRNWHLRDVVWADNAARKIDVVHRKWKPTARDLVKLFPGKISPQVSRAAEKEPFREFECRHIVMPGEDYNINIPAAAAGELHKIRAPFVSVYLDVENDTIMEERGVRSLIYVIPRWFTVSGSQYATSPAVTIALPEARLIQAMALTMLEAAEHAVRPPMIATQEALRSDIDLTAGGITYADADYDERKGDVLRPIDHETSGLPFGMEMLKDSRSIITEAFYLNRLSMPPQTGPQMTATEVGQRVQDYIRKALPLFEPMEMDYNGAICDATFELLMQGGAFGSPADMPQSLRGQEVQFRFESPLSEAIDAQKGQKFAETNALIAQAVQYDPTSASMVDSKIALRDALRGIGAPAAWLRSEQQMAAIEQQAQAQHENDALLQRLSAGSGIVKNLGAGAASFKQAGIDAAGVAQPAAA